MASMTLQASPTAHREARRDGGEHIQRLADEDLPVQRWPAGLRGLPGGWGHFPGLCLTSSGPV